MSPSQMEGNQPSCHNSRNTLRSPIPCELRPDSPAETPEQSRAPSRKSNGDLTSQRQHERLPEFPGVPAEESQASRCNSRKIRRFPCPRDMRPFVPSCRAKIAIPTALSKFERRLDSLHTTHGGPEIPVTPREEFRVSSHNSRSAPCFPPHLEMRAHSWLQLKRNCNFPSHQQRRLFSFLES